MAEIFTEIMKEKKDVLQSKLFDMIKVQVFKEFHKIKTKYVSHSFDAYFT